MKNQDFSTAVLVEQTPAEVYDIILNVRAWWSGLFDESFDGCTDKVGDEFRSLAGGGVHYTKQRLVELVPNEKIAWLVTEANLSFVEKADEWKGTKIRFEISRKSDKTKIVFTHLGLVQGVQCYDSCASAWTQYIHERLLKALSKKNL